MFKPFSLLLNFEEYTQTYYEALNQTLFVQNYRGVYPSTFYSLEVYDTRETACLKIRERSISNFKTSVCLYCGVTWFTQQSYQLCIIKEWFKKSERIPCIAWLTKILNVFLVYNITNTGSQKAQPNKSPGLTKWTFVQLLRQINSL